jgi:hypothetical protein
MRAVAEAAEAISSWMHFARAAGDPAEDELPLAIGEAGDAARESGVEPFLHFGETNGAERLAFETGGPLRLTP